MHVVFMGVSGCGKSTIALRVAERLSLPFAEADQFHPDANIAKMSAGEPLTDADREPWLMSLAAWISEHEQWGQESIVACSALKRTHRNILRRGANDVRFIHLEGSTSTITERLRTRSGHFMPPGLLDSQREALQPLEPDEAGVTLDVSPPPGEIAEHATALIVAAHVPDPNGHSNV